MLEKNSIISNRLTLEEINKSAEKNIDQFVHNFFKMQYDWMIMAYNIYKDTEKYLILAYLIKKTIATYNKHFLKISFDDFYSYEKLEIEEIKIVELVKDLDIKKETARRKINELSNDGVIIRSSRKITINQKAFNFQKPFKTIKNYSRLLQLIGKNLNKNDNLSNFEINDFENKIKKNYTQYWNNFLNYQISYMLMGKKYFGDYETFLCVGVCALNQSYNLINKSKNEKISDIADAIASLEKSAGLNPTTISDLSGIPRATVIRKISVLQKKGIIYKNEQNLYLLCSPKKNKAQYEKLKKRFNENQEKIKLVILETLNLIRV